MARKISFLDKTFWITESEDNPKHVAGLQILEAPEGATDDYVTQLYAEMRSFDYASEPFNCRVRAWRRLPLKLVALKKIDLDYHLHLHHIADIDDRKALNTLVAGLHEKMLDRDKPLWQFHLIKGDRSREFAIYVKVHHMYGDGVTLVRWFQSAYLSKPKTEDFVPPWAIDRTRRAKGDQPSLLKRIVSGIWTALLSIKDILIILMRLLVKLLRINKDYMPIPFSGTKTLLTGQVKKGRLVSTLDLDFERVRKLAKRTRATANEILLCVFDIGVHRFLKDHGHSFNKALYTNMPINLRKPGEKTSGNMIAIVPVRLAYGQQDPYLRLRQIIGNHRIVIKASNKAQPMAFSYYTVIIQSFALLFEMLHLSDFVKPIANILISNVPGPRHTCYLKDAKLVANYPVSTMTPGGGVNITLITYDGIAHVGFVSGDNNVDSLDPMVQYCAEAFEMLEKCIDDPSLSVEDIGEQDMISPHMSGEEMYLESSFGWIEPADTANKPDVR